MLVDDGRRIYITAYIYPLCTLQSGKQNTPRFAYDTHVAVYTTSELLFFWIFSKNPKFFVMPATLLSSPSMWMTKFTTNVRKWHHSQVRRSYDVDLDRHSHPHMTVPVWKMYTVGTWSHTNHRPMYSTCIFSRTGTVIWAGCGSWDHFLMLPGDLLLESRKTDTYAPLKSTWIYFMTFIHLSTLRNWTTDFAIPPQKVAVRTAFVATSTCRLK
jgi:hypothetical protein